MSDYLRKITNPLKHHKRITIVAVIVLVFCLSFLITYFKNNATPNIQLEITPYSSVTRDTGRTVFSLNTNNKYLFKSKDKKGLDAAVEFLKSNPSIGGSAPLFPSDYSKNSNVTRQIQDSKDKYLNKNGISINNEHYFFDQKINGIPVYGATVVVHLKNGSEVYSTSGNVSVSKTQTQQKISEEKAIQIALDQAKIESKTDLLEVEKTKKFYINDQVLGLSNDSKNKLALEVMVISKGKPVLFGTQYFVSLTDGKMLYSESQTRDLLDRNIYSCTSSSCNKVRSEGGPAVGDTEADNLYSYFDTVYSYYKNTFNRDSYDDSGATYNGYVHVPSNPGGPTVPANSCPNAQWTRDRKMVFCTGLVTPDVTGHELTHAVTFATANLIYQNEPGALNEAVSDIFGSAMDNNWDIGEGLSPSAGLPIPLRSMSNPPSRNQPDKLSAYNCTSSDSGGVHINSGIINKAFYLMTDGGSFNGCTMSGIGRAKSHPIVYQALTKYLTQTSNFKDAYSTFLQACGDLYGATSTECDNVNRAMQATLIDQQTQGSPQSPTCTGATLQPATCATAGSPSPNPTSSTTPSPSPSTTPSTQLTNEIIGTVFTDTNNNSKFDAGEPGYQGAVITLTGAMSSTATTDSSGNFSFKNAPAGSYTLVAKVLGNIVGQGTFTIPADHITTMKIFIPLNPLQTTPTPVILQPTVITPIPSTVPSTTPDTGGGGKFEPHGTPTPTPDQFFSCKPDPACVASGKSIQLCPLKCSPQ